MHWHPEPGDTGFWAVTKHADVLEVAKLARENIFLPANIFTLDGPLWDAFGLMVDEDMSAQEAMDQAASDIQSNLDRAWSTYEQI